MPVGTVGPGGLELPQQLADAAVGPGRGVGDHHGDHKQENGDSVSGDGVVLEGYF